jgi:hypothetical protein
VPQPKPTPTPVQRPTPTLVQRPTPSPVPAAAAAAPQSKPAPTPEPALAPAPKPEPKQQPPARITTRTLAATAAPAAAALADEDDADSQTLLRRLVFAAEVSAGITAAPARIRTPLGVSPLLDCQLRLCIAIAGAPHPLMRSELSRGWLTKEQQAWLEPALEDGVRRGGFTATGGRGKANRGARYSLADPTVFDGVTWEAVTAAVEAQRRARERRQVGSGAGAAAAS